MTTIAQARQVIQPLLQRHSDLALVDRHLILTPVHHFVRGVFMGRSGSAKIFVPTVDVNIIFTGVDHFHYGWGNTRLIHPFFSSLEGNTNERAQVIMKVRENDPYFGSWDFNNAENMEVMLQVIENALQPLRHMTTLEDAISFASRDENNFTPLEVKYYVRLLMATALGKFDEAIQILDGPDYRQVELRQWMDHWRPTFYPALIAGDRLELAKFLHEMEAKTVKARKFHKIWEPMPFPLELSATRLQTPHK